MRSSNNINTNQDRKKLPALINLWHFYPTLFLSIVLIVIVTYFIFSQIHKYNIEVDRVKKEFTAKQRIDLKIKVLSAKDYIYWVKAHPETYIKDLIYKKTYQVQQIIDNHCSANEINAHELSLILDSIDEINKKSVFKLILLDQNLRMLHSASINKEKISIPFSLQNGEYAFHKVTEFSTEQVNSLGVNGKLNVFYKAAKQPEYFIGFFSSNNSKDDMLKEIILDSLSQIKYNNNEYIFINTYNGYALLSKGNKLIEPVEIAKSKESNWKQIFNYELKYAQSPEGGYYTYFWSNSPNSLRKEKTSFFSGVHDWNWIIGTGYFADDVNPIIDEMKSNLRKEIVSTLVKFLIFLLCMSLLIYLITKRYASNTKKNIQLFLNFFKRAAHGLQVIDKEKLAFEEFSVLADAANHMIFEREKIKTVLATEKSKLRHMIDAIPDLIFFKGTDSLFEGCNTAFEKFIGKSSSEIAGLSEYELFGKIKAENYIRSDRKIFEMLLPERSSEWITLRNGDKRLFDTLKTPYFDSNKKLIGIIGISRDITEMEETRQRLLLAKEKAEESDRLKTAFLANMSHEIRTPMNAIIGFSDLLAEEDLSIEDRNDFISKIKTAGNSLMSLINDIIDIAKIEAGQLKITDTEINLFLLMKELHSTFTNLKNISGKESIELNLLISEQDQDLWIYSDPFRLQQIVTNLLNNALKFTEFGSVDFGYERKDNFLNFFVKDTGIGILRSKQKLLFKRFSQVDAGSNRKYGGTGLGLAISSNLVDLLGGTIAVDSIPGKGSTFTFSIPYKSATRKHTGQKSILRKDIDWAGKSILIAEDSMQNYLLVEAVLRFTNVELIHATDGQKAIELAKSNPKVDLILMDIQLPVKTGYEALKEIQELFPSIPVISYTAFALPNEREKSLNAGFVDYIPKPIKAESLIPILDKYLSKPGL